MHKFCIKYFCYLNLFFFKLIESLEEINSFIPEQNRRADPIIIDDVNDFQGPDVFDNSRKTEKMQTVNKNPFSDLSNSEFPKREDVKNFILFFKNYICMYSI